MAIDHHDRIWVFGGHDGVDEVYSLKLKKKDATWTLSRARCPRSFILSSLITSADRSLFFLLGMMKLLDGCLRWLVWHAQF